jgi:hypothetical protein
LRLGKDVLILDENDVWTIKQGKGKGNRYYESSFGEWQSQKQWRNLSFFKNCRRSIARSRGGYGMVLFRNGTGERVLSLQ